MEERERRHARRYAIRIPLAFRSLKPDGFPRCSGDILDISTDGVRFATQTPLSSGATVKVYLKLPRNHRVNQDLENRHGPQTARAFSATVELCPGGTPSWFIGV